MKTWIFTSCRKKFPEDVLLTYCHSYGSHQATDTYFCGICDTIKRPLDVHSELNQEELLKRYFLYGFDHQTICMSLEKFAEAESQLAYERLKDA